MNNSSNHFLFDSSIRNSSIFQSNQQTSSTIPSYCVDQPILQEIESIESFEKRSILYKFWKSMFASSYPTSWWIQFTTLVSRNIRVEYDNRIYNRLLCVIQDYQLLVSFKQLFFLY